RGARVPERVDFARWRSRNRLDRAWHDRRHQHAARAPWPPIGVITTRGFRDVIEMRRRDRRRTWGLWGDFVPIADRDMRVEVNERTLADGSIRRAVDEAEIQAAARLLLEKGAQGVAITFINAYANAENERSALAQLRAVWPNEFVTASHEVLSEIREF